MGSPAVIERMLFGLGFRDFGVMYFGECEKYQQLKKGQCDSHECSLTLHSQSLQLSP